MGKIAITNSLEGNVGNCQINSSSYNVDLFTVEVVATDSCTGTVISKNQMFDSGWLVFGLMTIGVMAFCFMIYNMTRY